MKKVNLQTFKLLPLLLGLAAGMMLSSLRLNAQYTWNLLADSPQNGQKQDDVFFVQDTPYGWSVNGSGKVYHSSDGGESWNQQFSRAGSYFRCIGFTDSLTGFLGNIGPGYFPGVSDFNPLYRTTDGGQNWEVVPDEQITGPTPTGLCAIQVIDEQHIVAAGRVGGPALWMHSSDGGNTWQSAELGSHIQMITDIYFPTPDIGYIFGGTSTNIQLSRARIIRTTDGGATWNTVYTGERTFELCWKAAFPTTTTAYATLLNYAPNYPERFLAKSVDGGESWEELPFVNNSQKAFGVGFVDDSFGWIGTDTGGYETQDGGLSWVPKDIGGYVNKIRLSPNNDGGWTGYAVGQRIYKMTSAGVSSATAPPSLENHLKAVVFPNPTQRTLQIHFQLPATESVEVILYDMTGRQLDQIFNGALPAGEQTLTYTFPNLPPGLVKVLVRTESHFEVLTVSVLP